jgi:hypothetical protein
MVHHIQADGKRTELTARENWFVKMEKVCKENSNVISVMEVERTSNQMDSNIKTKKKMAKNRESD